MKKEMLISMITSGIISIAALEDGNYVLVITTMSKTFVVPMIVGAKTKIAYVNPTYTEDIYFMIDEILQSIITHKTFDIPRFTLFKSDIPEHNKVIKEFLVSEGKTFLPEGIQEALAEYGYSYTPHEIRYTKAYDFSEQRKDPEAADNVAKNHAEVEAKGGKYEDLPEDLKAAYKSVMIGGNSDPYAIILQGPTGTGKSFSCKILADHFQAPILTLNISEGTTVEQLEGDLRYLEGKGGEIGFVPGPFAKAYINGGFVVLDEVNSASPNTLNVIHGYIDGNTKVSPTTYSSKYFERNKNFVVFMTMNPGYGETNILTPAMKNRCKIVDVPKWDKDYFAQKVVEASERIGHKLSLEFGKELFNFAGFIEQEAHSSKFHSNAEFSIRNALGLLDVICMAPQTREEFEALININYINILGSDQDNSIKLAGLKGSSVLKDRIDTLYRLYNFTPVDPVKVGITLDELLKGFEKTPEDKEADATGDYIFGEKTAEIEEELTNRFSF